MQAQLLLCLKIVPLVCFPDLVQRLALAPEYIRGPMANADEFREDVLREMNRLHGVRREATDFICATELGVYRKAVWTHKKHELMDQAGMERKEHKMPIAGA